MAGVEPTGFTIRELTGEGRQIDLIGRGLPYRPISIGGKQRITKTWYPGNASASAQVIGVEENETTISGFWKDRFIALLSDGSENPAGAVRSDGQPLEDVFAAISRIDDIRRKGQAVRVTWGRVAREGYLTEFVQKWHNTAECEWEMRLEWTGQAEPDPAPLLPEPDIGDMNDEIQNAGTQLAESKNAWEQTFSVLSETMQAGLTAMQSALDEVEHAGDAVRQVVNQIVAPAVMAQRMLAVLSNMQSEARIAVSAVQSIAPTYLAAGQAMQDGPVHAGAALAAFGTSRAACSSARRVAVLAARHSESLAKTAPTAQSVQAVIVRDGDSLRSLAVRFYGTQNAWRTIAEYNHLESSAVAVGQVVLVPLQAKTGIA